MQGTQKMLGRYTVQREIARGSTGTVFEAFDASNGNRVAIKVLRHALQADAVSRQRFLREVEAASRVDDPAIVKIHGWGVQEGSTYIAMELVDGQPLSKLLSPIAPFPLENTVRIVHDVALGLASVHRAGLVHRDIKPDNIIVLKDASVKVSDFGIVKFPDSALTQVGQILGTLHYMSPEQIRGAAEIDGRSDMFSLGAVLFEMLTCKRPFDGDGLGADLMERIVRNPAPRVTSLNPGLPMIFDAIVSRALAKNPAARFSDCEHFALVLANAMPYLRLGQLGAERAAPGPRAAAG